MGNGNELRWDLTAMDELATALEHKADRLLTERSVAMDALAQRRCAVEMRSTVLAAMWSADAAAELRLRRRLLESAEHTLLADIGLLPAIHEARRPPLRSRSVDDISRDLDDVLGSLLTMQSGSARAQAELTAARLTLEMAAARRAELVMGAALPDPVSVQALDRLIDFLAYEVAKAEPAARPDSNRVAGALSMIRHHLDESWFGDVGRADLLEISDVVAHLPGPELDAVIQQLSDAELYRWLRELDGIRGGNLSTIEETELFGAIAQRASATTLFRLARAEEGGKFAEIAEAIQGRAPIAVAMEFIELCAASAARSDAAMLAAVSGLAALQPAERLTVYASLRRSGLADGLAEAARKFIEANTIERSDPVIVEFFKGVADALTGTVRTVANLTMVGLYDTHEFREAWSRLGNVIAMVPQDPVQFVAVVIDLDTMTKNPAKWTGGAVADLAMLGIGRLARLGRLGSLAKAAADWLKRLGSRRVVGSRRLQIESGHLMTAVERLYEAADAAQVRSIIDDVTRIEAYASQLEEFVSRLSGLDPAEVVAVLQDMAAAVEEIIEDFVTTYFPDSAAA